MTYKTHRVYAIGFSLIAAMYVYIRGLTSIDYYLALPILLMTGKYGGMFPDIDHDWANVKDKTVPNWVINKLIHWTGGRHRSWQTHSIDILIIVIALVLYVPGELLDRGHLSVVNYRFYERENPLF